MQVAFANNQILTNDGTADPVIYTDPIALGNADRISGVVNVHYIYGTNADLDIKTQVSNDGVYWVDEGIDTSGAASYPAVAIGATGQFRLDAATVLGAFIRVAFEFDSDDTAAIGFDFHSTLDHA